ncbi:hypothetical protein BJX99DRAFT_226821 [Aspergillus californicus]
MRPALLRLLKRPSALSVIDSIITSPSGIRRLGLEFDKTCIRCYSSSPQPLDAHSLELLSPDEPSNTSTQPSSFRVHDIRSHHSSARSSKLGVHGVGLSPSESTHDNRLVNDGDGISTGWQNLSLRPERLEYESDVVHTHDFRTRLVDDPTHQKDIFLWLELLRYRQRRHGDNGTSDIWEGLMARGLQLPVDGEIADIFWQSFVDLGLKREAILHEVVDYALKLWNKLGQRWPKLYQSIVGGLLERGMAFQALGFHKRLQNPHLSDPSDIAQCLKSLIPEDGNSAREVGSLAKSPGRSLNLQLSAFREICKNTDGHRIYGQVIHALASRAEFTEAFRMHFFLTRRGDHAQTLEDIQPLLEHSFKHRQHTVHERLRQYCADRLQEQYITGEVETPVADYAQEPTPKDGVDGRHFKDDFGARVFATKALNFDMILAGLKMFSVSAIGPHSLREMALRSRGSHDVLEKLEQLDKAGISIGTSVFARLLRRLASENREILLSDLIHSDQHPDMLEDSQSQESLLMSYYTVRDWRQYNLTLAVLKELLGEGLELINVHIRKHLTAKEWTLASKIVADNITQGGILTSETLNIMLGHTFTPRRPGAGPAQHGDLHQELTLIFRFLQHLVRGGSDVPPPVWHELFKRLGMADRWDDLRTCCLWLARHYSSFAFPLPFDYPRSTAGAPSRVQARQMLAQIFHQHLQDSLVEWGFIVKPTILRADCEIELDGDRLVPYVRGLIFLRELEQMGIQVRLARVRQVCRRRLVVLYGPPVAGNKRRNRELRSENPFRMGRVITDINRAWGESPLFDDNEKSRLFRAINPLKGPLPESTTTDDWADDVQ